MRLVAFFIVIQTVFAQVPEQKPEEPLRILFLGNSYTYYNALPDMVMTLANSTPGRRLETKSVTRGGATLADLWNLTNALEVLRSGTWDYRHSLDYNDRKPNREEDHADKRQA